MAHANANVSVVLLAAAVLAAAAMGCGGRSGALPEDKPGIVVKDGSPGKDGTLPRDHTLLPPDRGPVAVDRKVTDSCLPIPAHKVQGDYAGTWKGKFVCKSLGTFNTDGVVGFSLTPSGSPESFAVEGRLEGMAEKTVPFQGTIKGSMGCTALAAKVPDLTASSPVMLKGQATMKAAFKVEANGTRWFPSGTWTATDSGTYKCTGSGTWSATHK